MLTQVEEEKLRPVGTVSGYNSFLSQYIHNYQPRRIPRKEADAISLATKDSNGKVSFHLRGEDSLSDSKGFKINLNKKSIFTILGSAKGSGQASD